MIEPGEHVTYEWEYTDTFNGEANYSWVRRGEVTAYVPFAIRRTVEERMLARKIKKAAGLTGVRGRSSWNGDFYEFRPYRACVVLFANIKYA
jgi:hypothetical protein